MTAPTLGAGVFDTLHYVVLDSPAYEYTSMELHSIKLRHNRLLIIISSVLSALLCYE